VAPLRDFPSARAFFASLHGRIYCATRGAAKEDHTIWGHGDSEEGPGSIRILLDADFDVEGAMLAGVEVETMLEPYPQPPELFVHAEVTDVISAAIWPPKPFPLTLTVERSKRRIPVDGRDHTFTTYTCGSALGATAHVGKLYLRLRCKVAEFERGFAIRSLSQAELERLVDEHRRKFHAGQWWEEQERGRDEPNA
jgi:hypothetical protein